jgi:hypothetical protein
MEVIEICLLGYWVAYLVSAIPHNVKSEEFVGGTNKYWERVHRHHAGWHDMLQQSILNLEGLHTWRRTKVGLF